MATLIVTRGLPGSGKTTAATAWVAEEPLRRARVERDEIRSMFARRATSTLSVR